MSPTCSRCSTSPSGSGNRTSVSVWMADTATNIQRKFKAAPILRLSNSSTLQHALTKAPTAQNGQAVLDRSPAKSYLFKSKLGSRPLRFALVPSCVPRVTLGTFLGDRNDLYTIYTLYIVRHAASYAGLTIAAAADRSAIRWLTGVHACGGDFTQFQYSCFGNHACLDVCQTAAQHQGSTWTVPIKRTHHLVGPRRMKPGPV